MTHPQAAEPTHKAESANEDPISQPEGLDPASLGAQRQANERAKAQEERDDLFKQVTGIPSLVAEAEEDLQKVEARMDVVLFGPPRDKLRGQRRTLLDRLEDLRMALDSGQKRIKVLDQLLHLDSAQKAIDTRKNCQASGAQIATEMRQTMQRLAELHHRWRVLKEEDRVAADVVRSVTPERYGEVPTYAYATAVDQNFSEAIRVVVGESLRAEKDLQKRREQRPSSSEPGG